MKSLTLVLLVYAAALLPGCYRTTYVNFAPPTDAPVEERQLRSIPDGYTVKNGWQHFYVWGWAPDKRTYAVDLICGGADRIESIHTRRTFVEGLVAAFAGYYINIYSPYNAAFECGATEASRSAPLREPAHPAGESVPPG